MTSIRIQQREATRGKILKTARRLFLNANFEQVGVREIAAEAGVATGTVIAAFGSKADLLNAIVIQDLNAQLPLMEAAAAAHIQTSDRIIASCLACVSYQAHQIAIVRASMADAWTRSDEAEHRIRVAIKPMVAFMVHELERGLSRCEVLFGIDLNLAAYMIFETLINTYRIPVYSHSRETGDLEAILTYRLKFLLRAVCTQDMDFGHSSGMLASKANAA
jgi:AcrR family transcriptional regulator